MTIGITGTLGAGKGTVVEYLKTKGFKHYSASGFIQEEILRRGMAVNRDTMVLVGNALRAEHGSGYISEQLLGRALDDGGDAVVESIRSVGEAQYLKEQHALLWVVDANPQTRYERISARGSEKDGVTFQKFMEQERLESNSADPSKQNLNAVRALCDTVLFNDGTREELYGQVERILAAVDNPVGR